MSILDSSIENLKGVNYRILKKLHRLGIRTIKDILFYFPKKYYDFSKITKISTLKHEDIATIKAKVVSVKNIKPRYSKITITELLVEDDTGKLRAYWYNQPYMIKHFSKGLLIHLSGKVVLQRGKKIMQNPIYEFLDEQKELTHTGKIIPIYKETKGLRSRWLRYLVKNALAYVNHLGETLPNEILKKRKLFSLKDAILKIHFPESETEKRKAKKRISYERLFFIQLAVLLTKQNIKKLKSPKLEIKLDFLKSIIKTLPFIMTNAQKRALWQILKDTSKEYPMNRLLEGDVGSGKTLVAILSCANAVKNGFQSVVMAPTEILAVQHFNEAVKILKGFDINIGLLTSAQRKIFDSELGHIYEVKRKEMLNAISNHKVDFVLGTHALIQDEVKFKKLGLLVLDEQHRFGVNQRSKLLKKQSLVPHFLSMTATPIPRTLAIAIYGDLDISVIDEMPKGRKKIITKYVPPQKREEAYKFIEKQIKAGRQAFVICPKIEPVKENEDEGTLTERQIKQRQVKAVKEEYEKLSNEIFPHLRVAMLHGKMKPKEKDQIMKDFKDKKYDILVSTSVIEVGVDVPNATIMMIEGADRFGLAQLHQFRGRVGRGEYQSYCFLFSDSFSEESYKRLKIMERSTNGFELAEYDLKLRGPGDFLGKHQSGMPDIAMEALMQPKLISEAKEDAIEMLKENPDLKNYPEIKQRVSCMVKEIHFE